MKALILAAGYATRLYPLTKDNPKPLLKVAGRPIINYLLDRLEEVDGIDKIFIVTNDRFLANFKHWLKGTSFKKNIKVISDGTKLERARIGAIGDIDFVIKKEKISDDLLILGGDNLFTWKIDNFVRCGLANSPASTIGVFDIKDKKYAAHYGVVSLDKNGRIVDFREKPKRPRSSLVAMCVYYFSQEGLGRISEYLAVFGKLSQHDATGNYINWLYRKEPVYGFVFKGRWYDIGHIDSYRMADELFTGFLKRRKVK